MRSEIYMNVCKHLLGAALRFPIALRRLTKSRALPDLSPERRVLVIAGIGLGNTVLALPMIRLLRRQLAQGVLDCLVIDHSSETILSLTGLADRIYLYRGSAINRAATILRCRRRRYDLCLMTFPTLSLPLVMLPLWLNARHNIGHDVGPYNPFFIHFRALYDSLIPAHEALHDARQNLNLLSPFLDAGAAVDDMPPLRVPNDAVEKASFFLERHGLAGAKPLFAIHPGSKAGARYKRWPVERYIELAECLGSSGGATVFIAGPDESMLIEPLQRRNLPVLQSDLTMVLGVIARSDVFISNDSGIMHVASLLNVPMVTIWGGTDERRNGARAERVINVTNASADCRPCVRIIPDFKCDLRDCRCLEGIGVREVYDAVQELRGSAKR